MVNRDTVKTWFETGDYPSQSQFHELFDSIYFKDEAIPLEKVAGLIDALLSKADYDQMISLISLITREAWSVNYDLTWVLPENKRLETIILIPFEEITVKIGTLPEGDDVMIETTLPGNEPFILDCAVYAKSDLTIYFTGITAQTDIFIYKR